jgi:protein involved in sex pheromone biosynthesis
MTYTCGHILCNKTDSKKANQQGGIVTAQSTAEDTLKMVVKKTETCRGFILTNTFLTF